MKKIVLMAAALMVSMFILTSCEKENVAEEIKACNYVLVKENVCDEYGNIGNLYEDQTYPNNPHKTYFKVTIRSKSSTRPFTGTWHKYVYQGIPQYFACEGEASNCWKDNNTAVGDCTPIIVNMTKKEHDKFIGKK